MGKERGAELSKVKAKVRENKLDCQTKRQLMDTHKKKKENDWRENKRGRKMFEYTLNIHYALGKT